MDRNFCVKLQLLLMKVALRKESVDRNMLFWSFRPVAGVALRKESVDRNLTSIIIKLESNGRSPQGERG